MEEKNLHAGTEPEQQKKEPSWKFAIPFFAALAVLTVVAFLIPLRPTQSYGEKRNLAQFPEFSWETLASGDYFDDITLWFADTFPGRESWLKLSANVEQLHGRSEITIYGDVHKGDDIPVLSDVPKSTQPTVPATTAPPETEPVETEPTSPPTLPPKETMPPPTEPVEQWGGVDAANDDNIVYGNVLQIGNFAFNYFGFNQYWSDYYVNQVNGLAQSLEGTDIRVVAAPFPTAVGVMVEPEYMEKIGCSDEGLAIDYVLGTMEDSIVKVDVFQNLVDHNDEYIYFRTDHHWTALGAYYAYEEICASLGMEPAPLESFAVMDQGEFKGSFYWSCNQNSRLEVDNLVAYDPPGDLEVWITQKEGAFPWTVLTDMSNSDVSSKYMTFLAGDNPLTEIINHDIPDAPKCVVVKDSFGNALAPFLTQNFSTVYAIDFRKYTAMDLKTFAEVYDVDYIIFGHALAMAQSEGGVQLFDWLCG